MKRQAYFLPKGTFAFENALKKPGLSFICECKKASPSKGVIAEEFPYLQIARYCCNCSGVRIEQINSTALAPMTFAS